MKPITVWRRLLNRCELCGRPKEGRPCLNTSTWTWVSEPAAKLDQKVTPMTRNGQMTTKKLTEVKVMTYDDLNDLVHLTGDKIDALSGRPPVDRYRLNDVLSAFLAEVGVTFVESDETI
jgi:hypothetical protein